MANIILLHHLDEIRIPDRNPRNPYLVYRIISDTGLGLGGGGGGGLFSCWYARQQERHECGNTCETEVGTSAICR